MILSKSQKLEFFQAVYDSADIGICVTDETHRFVLVNAAYCRTYGYSRDELIGQPFTNVLPQDMRTAAGKLHDDFLVGGEELPGEWEVIDKACRRKQVLVTAGRVVLGENQRFKVTTVMDVTEQRQTERELQRLSKVVSRISHGVIFTDPQGLVTWCNNSAVHMTGYSLEEMRGRKPGDLFQGADSDPKIVSHMAQRLAVGEGFQVEIINYTKAGEPYWLNLACSPVLDSEGCVEGYIALQTDISERKATEQRIQKLAYHDPLTGLPNRLMAKDQLKFRMMATQRDNKHSALLLLDLDSFKLINETLGPREGDRLLNNVAQSLRETIYASDLVARIGGDEFVVVLSDLSPVPSEAASQIDRAAGRILEAVARPFGHSELEHRVSASLGAVLFAGHHREADELMQQADIAMYQAKSAGGNTFRLFDPQMQYTLVDRHRSRVELREAIHANQLLPYFQGQVDGKGNLKGAELLCRWRHPTRGLLAPEQFIPIAEEAGLIADLGLKTIAMAAKQLARWEQDPRTRDLSIAVNVSLSQFEQDDFTNSLERILTEHGLDQPNLKLELTESVLAQDIDVMRKTMSSIQRLGIDFSLDDFGTGYSSLAYLKRLPIGQLKIDRSFVGDMLNDRSDRDIIETVIALAQSLKMNVIAEGVETVEQLDLLHSLGCELFQGFFFDRPAPIDEFSTHHGLPGSQKDSE